jgi:hypothetical protein
MYKIINILGLTFVVRESDNAHIPINEDNMDYQEYLKWVAEGNTAEEQ